MSRGDVGDSEGVPDCGDPNSLMDGLGVGRRGLDTAFLLDGLDASIVNTPILRPAAAHERAINTPELLLTNGSTGLFRKRPHTEVDELDDDFLSISDSMFSSGVTRNLASGPLFGGIMDYQGMDEYKCLSQTSSGQSVSPIRGTLAKEGGMAKRQFSFPPGWTAAGEMTTRACENGTLEVHYEESGDDRLWA
jgi:hypothetical protein